MISLKITMNRRVLTSRSGGPLAHTATQHFTKLTKSIAQQYLQYMIERFNEAVANAPVDTGNLVRSAYITWASNVKGVGATMPRVHIPRFANPNPHFYKGDPETYRNMMRADHVRIVSAANAAVQSAKNATKSPMITVVFGFSAFYATWVHEGHKVFNSGKRAAPTKFLEFALKS